MGEDPHRVHQQDLRVQQRRGNMPCGDVAQVRDAGQEPAHSGVPRALLLPLRPKLRHVVQLLLKAAHVSQPVHVQLRQSA